MQRCCQVRCAGRESKHCALDADVDWARPAAACALQIPRATCRQVRAHCLHGTLPGAGYASSGAMSVLAVTWCWERGLGGAGLGRDVGCGPARRHKRSTRTSC
eukprot:3835692-Rhodomonas_salina.1